MAQNEKEQNDYRITYYNTVSSKEVDWLWYPYIPYGKITILQGDPGEGKSTMMMQLAALITNGDAMPDGSGDRIPGNVIYQAAEDGIEDTIKPRLEAAGADCSRIAFLEQDTYLFDMTIAENIGIAKPGASMEEIKDAAKRAGIAEFIHTLPDGYDTDMGQMSARLSGGERQRIGIARILLRNPDICLMDEPSSALDALHEKELLHTLQTAYAGKTLLLISHRGSTLTGCSRILRAEDLK